MEIKPKRYSKSQYTEHDWNYFNRQFHREQDAARENLALLRKTRRTRDTVNILLALSSVTIFLICMVGILSAWSLIGSGVLLLAAAIGYFGEDTGPKIKVAREDLRIAEVNVEEWFHSDMQNVPFKDDSPVPVTTSPMPRKHKELEGRKDDPFHRQMVRDIEKIQKLVGVPPASMSRLR